MCGRQGDGRHLREPFSEITARVTTKTSMFKVGGCSQMLVHAAVCAYCGLCAEISLDDDDLLLSGGIRQMPHVRRSFIDEEVRISSGKC